MSLLQVIVENDEESFETKSTPVEIKTFKRKRKFKKRFHEKDSYPPRDGAEIHESETALCVMLWRSVIMQAIYDLSGTGGNSSRRIIRAESLSWFGAQDEKSDFENVCEMANLDPAKVRIIVKEVRENGIDLTQGLNFRSLRKEVSNRKGRKRAQKIAEIHNENITQLFK